MAYELNFSLLGPPSDVASAVQAGYQRGREMRLQNMQESAFDMLARDPNSAAGRAMLVRSGRPDLARQFRQWGREDRREEMFRSAFSGGAPAPVATPSAFAPASPATAPAENPPAPVSAAPVPMTAPAVTAPPAPSAAPASSRLPPLNPVLMQQYYAEDPEGAQQLVQTWNQLDAMQRAEQTRRFAAAVPILSEVARLPVEQRGAAVRSQADYLVSNGWTPEQVENYAADPSDQNTRMLLRLGVPIAEQRQFFAPLEGGQGAVYRDPNTLAPIAANPSQPRTEASWDANGNQMLTTVPGTPAIGPGANLFGSGAQGGTVAPQRRTATNPQTGERITVEQDPQTGQWRPVADEAPGFRPAPGGAAPGQRNFP